VCTLPNVNPLRRELRFLLYMRGNGLDYAFDTLRTDPGKCQDTNMIQVNLSQIVHFNARQRPLNNYQESHSLGQAQAMGHLLASPLGRSTGEAKCYPLLGSSTGGAKRRRSPLGISVGVATCLTLLPGDAWAPPGRT